jgi:hypothetical protein
VVSDLYSDAEFGARFVAALGELDDEPELNLAVHIEHGSVGLPRASSIGACARQQSYALDDEPKSDPGHPGDLWAPLMGWMGQELSIAVLRRMGYSVGIPGLGIVGEVVSVHPDGVMQGLDLSAPTLWDSKLRGLYGMKKLVQAELPLEYVDPQMALQMQVGMAAEDTERALVTVHPHDLSAWKTEIRRSTKNPIVMAEPVVHRVIVERDDEQIRLATDRAEGLLSAKALGLRVAREYDNTGGKFPCTYCEWRTRCIDDDLRFGGDDMVTIRPLPDGWGTA